ncbi:hypothetical protein D3C87_1171630 [compost metagenome]
MVTSVSMAAVNLGSYTGQTENGEKCSVEINQTSQSYDIAVSYTDEDSENAACEFKANHVNETTKELKVSGGHDSAVCKVRVSLANDGTPLKAQLGVGQYFQFGFDVTCSNLQKN